MTTTTESAAAATATPASVTARIVPGAADAVGDGIAWAAHATAATDASAAPGTILAVTDAGVAVAASGSTVTITELQRPGGKRLAAADFLRGFDLKPGQVFG